MPSAYMSMIELSLTSNDIPLAEKYCDILTSRHPKEMHGQYLKALIQMKKGNVKDAVAMLENLSRNHPEAPYVRTQLGNAYRMLGKIEATRRVLEDVHSRHPNYLPAILNLALLSRDSDNLESAINYYQAILNRRPSMAAAWNDLGILLERTRQREKAKDAFHRAIQHGKSPQFWFNLGKLLHDEGNIDEAISLLEEAARMDDNYLKPKLFLICCYKKKNDRERINTLITQLKATNPDLLQQLPCTMS